jgi:predicted transcriptional regulator
MSGRSASAAFRAPVRTGRWAMGAAISRDTPGRVDDRAGDNVVGSVSDVTVSISITLDDELGEELNAAVAGSNRSALVAQAIREYLDRRAIAAAAAWHASLEGEDAAVFAEFNAAW